MDNFNFDEWANLYKTHPEEFERKRKAVTEELIQNAPIGIRNNLRLIQMECDVYHDTMSPLAGTVAITNLMIQKSTQLKTELEKFDIEVKDFVKKNSQGD